MVEEIRKIKIINIEEFISSFLYENTFMPIYYIIMHFITFLKLEICIILLV
ncbi:MAG: hypothetical protein MR938_02920 [Tenericutes bacterium]|nr:hypothetical protein [Mycoplasmatota bacterium]